MNESAGCSIDVPKIPRDLFHRVFAVDGGSTDGTVEILSENGITVYRQKTKGYNGAYLTAIHESKSDALIVFHPKGSIDPNSLRQMTLELSQGVDLVIASRMLKSSRNEEDDKILRIRKWFVRMLSLAAKIRWGLFSSGFITDPIHGYRGFSKEFLKSFTLRDYGLTADLEIVQAAYSGRKIFSEFPVQEFQRVQGESHFPAYRTGKLLIRYLFSSIK